MALFTHPSRLCFVMIRTHVPCLSPGYVDPSFPIKSGQESLFATYLAFLKQYLPGYIPSRSECLYPPKVTHMGVHGSRVHTSPVLEAARHLPINRMGVCSQRDRARQCTGMGAVVGSSMHSEGGMGTAGRAREDSIHPKFQ